MSRSIDVAITVRPVSVPTPKCSFVQDRRVRAPCVSTSHSPALHSVRCCMGLRSRAAFSPWWLFSRPGAGPEGSSATV